MLMDNLPRLRREPIATKLAVYRKVGGHPKSIELLEGWLASGTVTDLLADPSLDGMLAQQWADYFLRRPAGPVDRGRAGRAGPAVHLRDQPGPGSFDYAEIKPDVGAPLARPLACSSAKSGAGVHSASRRAEYLTGRMTKDERRRAHEWAAAYYGRPFVEMARRAAESSKLEAESWTEEEIENVGPQRCGQVRWWPAPTTWPRPAPRWAAPRVARPPLRRGCVRPGGRDRHRRL